MVEDAELLQLIVEKECKPGVSTLEIAQTIDKFVTKSGYKTIPALVGHGIGRLLHEPPKLYNDPRLVTNQIRLWPDMTICPEPMFSPGSGQVYLDDDGWTVSTRDNKPAIAIENTILITDEGCEILTNRRTE